MTNFAGIFPIVNTTFRDDGSLDLESQTRLVRFLLDSGAHGLGLFGTASDTLGSLLSGAAFPTTLAADAAYTIFDGGGRRANVAVSEAQRDAALAAYELAIQSAFREVADALAVQGTIGEQLRAARANSAAAADSARLTEARYRGGIDSFLANLVAQRALYEARRRETAVLLASLRNRTELYRALGSDGAVATPAAGTG